MQGYEHNFYGPNIDNSNESIKNQLICNIKQNSINNINNINNNINCYQKKNIYATNNLYNFGKITYNKKSYRLKCYIKFLYNNRNNYHNLSEKNLSNLVKLLNKFPIYYKDIPDTFKTIDKNKPLYASNNHI